MLIVSVASVKILSSYIIVSKSVAIYFFLTGSFKSFILVDNLSTNENKLFIAKSNEGTLYSSVNIFGDEIKTMNPKGEINFDYVYTGVSYIYDYEDYWN